MHLRLLQIRIPSGRAVVAARGEQAHIVQGVASTYELALRAISEGRRIEDVLADLERGEAVDPREVLGAGRVLSPIDHPDPAHCLVSVTGLTHLGSAESRDRMHQDLQNPAKLTDTMRMFRLGVEGGKPKAGEHGAQPEWLWKGSGHSIVAPEAPIPSPDFALDHGEEPEIAGIYVIGPDGQPYRVGFALGNEFSDHVTERQNYLYLSHSKLRHCSIGPEILVGDLPSDIRGTSRIRRNGATIWEKPFLSGEVNMCHTVANLEAHAFKYDVLRQPGDMHVYFFGTATLSFADGFRSEDGDVFELEAAPFALPLRNPLKIEKAYWAPVRAL